MQVTVMYHNFLGLWRLVPECSNFEQGEAPVEGGYRIEETANGALKFHIEWTDIAGEDHHYSFSGKADGQPHTFPGGDLADSLSITAVNNTELNTAAYFKDCERMVVKRVLMDGGLYMDVHQTVRLPDGTEPSNFSRYIKVTH